MEPTPVITLLNEVLEIEDRRTASSAFLRAKEEEISCLVERESRKIKVNQLPRNANFLGGRLVYTLKNAGINNEQPKARYVAEGQKDREKPFIVHSILTLRQSLTIS